jgi:hypothetical protein
MNIGQRKVWVIAGAAAFACLVFPPFSRGNRYIELYSGHSFLWSPPNQYDSVYLQLLVVELLAVAVLAGVAHLVLGSPEWVRRIEALTQSVRSRASRRQAKASTPEAPLKAPAPPAPPTLRVVSEREPSIAAEHREPYIGEVESVCPACHQRVTLPFADPTAHMQVTCPRCSQKWRYAPRRHSA